MKIIIIDDEEDAIDVLENIIELSNIEYEIVGKTTNPVEGVNLILSHKPDVVFLDIEMPEMNGFEVLESIGNIDFDIIFATAYDGYAIRAIKENALDYILKPVTLPEVMNALLKVKEKINSNDSEGIDYKQLINNLNTLTSKRIRIPTSNGFSFIETDNVIFLQAEGSYTKVVLNDNSRILISKPIKQIEDKFKSDIFLRVHRSYIVNLNQIQHFNRNNYSLIMYDGSSIPISRRRYNEFIERIEDDDLLQSI